MEKVKILEQQLAFDGKHVKVRVDRVIEPGAPEAVREIVVAFNAVCIVARPTPDQVILIRQYRHAVGMVLREIPAGGLRDGEDPTAAAIRELEEETGYLAATIVERGGFWLAPGYSTEFMHVYEASGLTKTEIHPDEDEVIDVDIVSSAEALKMIDDGRIQDAKSIASLLKVLGR